MFIHWGLYSMPARHEWVKTREEIPEEQYDKYFQYFNPDLYDAARMGAPGEGRGHEVRRAHHKAPRGLLHVGHPVYRL